MKGASLVVGALREGSAAGQLGGEVPTRVETLVRAAAPGFAEGLRRPNEALQRLRCVGVWTFPGNL